MSEKRRTFRKKQDMFRLVEQCNESSLNIKQFCRKNDLATQTFYYWKKKYKKEKKKPIESSFIPVRVNSSSPKPPSEIQIEYPNGVKINVTGAVDPSFLGTLVNLV